MMENKVLSYKTWVKKIGSRKGHLVCGNGPEMDFGAPPDAQGEVGWFTPEDAFVAAVNTCIHMIFIWTTERMKIDLVSYECEAEGFKKVYLDKTEEFTHVVLRPKITVRNTSEETVRKALQTTQKYSLIASSIKSKLMIEPVILVLPS
jgi:organic hydroperoxide reductase OsmC/OhrA